MEIDKYFLRVPPGRTGIQNFGLPYHKYKPCSVHEALKRREVFQKPMDPCSALGLAASILQIINTTAQTIQYLKDVRDAPEDRAQILGETASLLGLLKDLRARVEHANQTDPWYVRIRLLEGQGGPLDQYQSAMIVLAKKLKPESGLKKLEKRLLWTFDRKQIKATLDLIERLKSLISLALQGDHLYGFSIILLT